MRYIAGQRLLNVACTFSHRLTEAFRVLPRWNWSVGYLYDPYPVFWKLLELHLLLHPPTPPRDTLNHNWCDFERLISHHSFVFLDYIGIVFLSGFENFLSRCVRRENFSSAVLLVKISSTAHTGRQPSWKKDMLFSVKWWDDSCDYGIPRIRILSQSCS